MGKKVSWFSAIKKAFTPNSKQKLVNDHETEKSCKKWGLGKIKHGGGASSFIPIYRKPSSIEKILGDVEKEQQSIITQPATAASDVRRTPSMPTRAASDIRRTPSMPTQAASDVRRTPSMPARASYHHQTEVINLNKTLSPKDRHASAIKIQAAYRGYMARRNVRALKGMVRLQGVIRGQNVKRQTMNAMKQMQLLVKVQSQIQLRRINMSGNQILEHQNLQKYDRELEGSLGRWTLSQTSEIGQNDEWDDSLLTKEEIDTRMQKKVEALMKKERILAYANSRKWLKAGSGQTPPATLRSGALPWWWLRVEQQLPKQTAQSTNSSNKLAYPSPSPKPQPRFELENGGSFTPKSSKSTMPTTPTTARKKYPPILSNCSTPVKHVKPLTNGGEYSFNFPSRDDDSFTSCPPLSRPNYMTPTIAAKAKLRGYDNLNIGGLSPAASSTTGQKRRMSFPLSLFSNNKDTTSSRTRNMQGNNRRAMSVVSVGNMSVDSTTSMPAGIGRRPFNRFV